MELNENINALVFLGAMLLVGIGLMWYFPRRKGMIGILHANVAMLIGLLGLSLVEQIIRGEFDVVMLIVSTIERTIILGVVLLPIAALAVLFHHGLMRWAWAVVAGVMGCIVAGALWLHRPVSEEELNLYFWKHCGGESIGRDVLKFPADGVEIVRRYREYGQERIDVKSPNGPNIARYCAK